MDPINSAVWPNGVPDQLAPQQMNPAASNWADLFLYGLSGAAVNAAYNLSNTVGAPQSGPTIGVSVGTSGNIMPLLIVAGLLYVVFKKG
ncbi:hypothetical protein HBDW_23580 [Herbaspirillum sp. DW155]|uniref:hypothetical protein n=1 Tax=Herbaspirillum sp. DW155 TaxID=3095609 RepID=UPI0030851673|nr:hypothetical protein HBDW_23580 [Herbaspirillum sp. DW155]